MLPSSTDITYFIEIGATLNLSRSAERLGVSQPSLSLSLQRLEDNIGTKLLLRSKRGVALTPAGRQFFSKAKALLQEWDNLQLKVVSSHSEVKGSFTIGCHPSVALYTLPDVVADLMNQHSELEIGFVHDLSRKITESVISVRVDLGIVVNPVKHPDLIIKKICEDEVCFWASERIKKECQNVIICDPDLVQTQDLLMKIKKSGFEIKRIINTSHLELAAEMTASGAGIGILPSRVALRRHAEIMNKKRSLPSFSDEICIIFRVENKKVKAIEIMTEAIEKALKT